LSAKADKYQSDLEANVLGREITEAEGYTGVQHVEPRDAMKQMHERDRYKLILNGPPPAPMTKIQEIDALIAQHEAEKAKKADPDGWELQQEKARLVAADQAKADYDKLMADPKRPLALRAATDWLLEVLYTPDATVVEVEHAQFLQALAWRTSDWGFFATEMTSARKNRANTIDLTAPRSEEAWKGTRAKKEALGKPFVL
jgi:hypothetical protein